MQDALFRSITVCPVTGGEKILGSNRIRTQGLKNTISVLYHLATEPLVDLPHNISPNTCTRVQSNTYESWSECSFVETLDEFEDGLHHVKRKSLDEVVDEIL